MRSVRAPFGGRSPLRFNLTRAIASKANAPEEPRMGRWTEPDRRPDSFELPGDAVERSRDVPGRLSGPTKTNTSPHEPCSGTRMWRIISREDRDDQKDTERKREEPKTGWQRSAGSEQEEGPRAIGIPRRSGWTEGIHSGQARRLRCGPAGGRFGRRARTLRWGLSKLDSRASPIALHDERARTEEGSRRARQARFGVLREHYRLTH